MVTVAREIERELSGYLTPTQACRLAGVSESWMRRCILSGRVNVIETPLGRLIDRNDVERMAQDRAAKREAASR